MRITIVLALATWIFISFCGSTYAQEDNIGQSQIHPAHPLYFLKTIRESLELKFAGTSRVTMLRELEFATRRLREINSLVKINKEDLIPPTLERYWSEITSLPDEKLEDMELTNRIKDSLVIHLKVLEEDYNKLSDPRAKMFVRSEVFRITQRKDIPSYAKVPACDFLSKEASNSALNEVERVILLERADKCRESLVTPSAHL